MKLSKELTSLVRDSVALLGQVIRHELGPVAFEKIETLRLQMSFMRNASLKDQSSLLRENYKKLEKLKRSELHQIASSFTFMLELINACENAYRSHRLSQRARLDFKKREMPEAIVYVLTAHPTEARAPQNIAIFHQIQQILTEALKDHIDHDQDFKFSKSSEMAVLHSIEIAWRTRIVRSRAPKVKDEADHIYSLLFRDNVILGLLDKSKHPVPFFVRSWVGGDKDGHPGVNEKTLLESLSLSRRSLLRLVRSELLQIRNTLELFDSTSLKKQIAKFENAIVKLKIIRTADSTRVESLMRVFRDFKAEYIRLIGSADPRIERIAQLFVTFPGLVVPLELRESSDVLMSTELPHEKLAIYKMLERVEKISRGSDPRNYVRGFIISMTESIDHIRMAARFQREVFGAIRLPIIPLFEQSESLKNSDKIISQMTGDKKLRHAAIKHWNSRIEMMVGYSDSAKEAGVLASRLRISEALPKLERVCEKAKLTPIFFHGSGGSIDRGGGSIEDQTAWWPRSALRFYKVTVQGEMVERSLASPIIAERQIDTIVESVTRGLQKRASLSANHTLDRFAKDASEMYGRTINSNEFLQMVEAATPYSYLNVLKIGSRPTKRSATLTVQGLRAIPWVLCWTQTRVLFQTWWGVGSAWQNLSSREKLVIKKCFKAQPVFSSYIKALGFTLAKIELSVWRLYLEKSGLPSEKIESHFKMFEDEFKISLQCYQEICGKKELMWAKPWLGESIELRSPMIHPLNMIQILAKKNKDLQLLRITVTGISSGMMTTG